MTTALIDGDLIIFRCSVVFTEPMKKVGRGTYKYDIDAAIENAKKHTLEIIERTQADKAVFVVSDKENFRKKLNPSYKGNRKGPKPVIYKELLDEMKKWSRIKVVSKKGLEADDVLGILATGDFKGYKDKTKIICTIDKDLQTIPGKHFNWNSHDDYFDGNFVEVDEVEAELAFFTQTLTGDSADGYKGCPGIGPKTAAKILERCPDDSELWGTIVSEFEKQGLTEEDALLNARMARILRAEDYDNKTGEVKLWEP